MQMNYISMRKILQLGLLLAGHLIRVWRRVEILLSIAYVGKSAMQSVCEKTMLQLVALNYDLMEIQI